MSVSINRFTATRCGTYLVYHIDEDLRVVPREAPDSVTLIFAQKYRLDQGGKFARGKFAPDQTTAGCSVETERQES